MAKRLILISHGQFCEALKASTEMIMGSQEMIETVSLLPEEGAADFQEKFLATLGGDRQVIVLADLLGGTPCNVVSRLIMEGYDLSLYAGANMPMVIEFINSAMIGQEPALTAGGAQGIIHVNDLLANLADSDDD